MGLSLNFVLVVRVNMDRRRGPGRCSQTDWFNFEFSKFPRKVILLTLLPGYQRFVAGRIFRPIGQDRKAF